MAFPRMMGRRVIMERVLSLIAPDASATGGLKKRMTVKDACAKVGIDDGTLYAWMAEDPKLREIWDNSKKVMKELMTDKAKSNIYQAIDGELGLKKKDLVDVSFRYLEKTNKEFNPAHQVEVKSMNMNFDMTLEELEEQIKSLMSKD